MESFSYQIPYDKTFVETLYGSQLVDYAQLPLNFDRYSEADQTRIAARMVAVLEAINNGLDLETAPFSVKNVTLPDALAQIEALKAKMQG